MNEQSRPRAAKQYIRADELQAVCQALLEKHDLPTEDARLVAACLVEADLRGVETHGVVRLTHYLNRIRLKLIKSRPNIVVTRKTPVAVHVNGDDGFGFVAATRAMNEAIDMAKVYGLGLAAVYNSSHFGMAASYVLQAVRAGYMSLVFTNASASMPPWGGKSPVLGTSPFAAGAPGGKLPPFVLDMSVAVAARGKIRLAALRGESVPEGLGLDKEGRATTDPKKILDDGVVLPVGGPKGSGIAMMMDIFGGVFTGSAFAGDVTNHANEFTKPQNVGHFIMAIKPDLFMSREDFEARMDVLTGRIKNAELADGFKEILVAGEPEAKLEAMRRAKGIQLPIAELDDVRKAADTYGCRFPELSNDPF